jgi:hypothetical protein
LLPKTTMAENISNRVALDRLYPQLNLYNARLRYENEVRPNLQTGDLIFFSGNHWLSGLIRLKSKSAWSHVGMVLKIEEIDRTFLIESIMENGVRVIPISAILTDYHGDNKPYNGRIGWARHTELTPELKVELRVAALDLLTKQYDGKEFFRVAWRTIVGRQKLFPDKKFTCAELIHDCFKTLKIRLEYDKGLFISPGSIWRNKAVEIMGILW